MKRLILSAVLLVVGLMAVQAQKFVLVDMELCPNSGRKQ